MPDNANKTIDVVSAYIKKADTNVSESRLDGRMTKVQHQTPEAPTSIVHDSTTASNDSILPSMQKNVKKELGADANRYLPKSQVSKVKSNTFDSAHANRELPRTVTPGELMQDMTSYINADTVTPQSRKVYNEYLSSAKRLQEVANDATVEIKEQSISRFTSHVQQERV